MKNLFKVVGVIAMTAVVSFCIMACSTNYDQFCPDCNPRGIHLNVEYGSEEDCTCSTCGGANGGHHGYVARR